MTSHARSAVSGSGSQAAGIEGVDIPLSSFSPSSKAANQKQHPRRQQIEDDEELDPESDSALLRRHNRASGGDEDVETRESGPLLNTFQRLGALMSKSPLLLRSSP